MRLNLRGREPQGVVAPEDAGAVLDEIANKLRELRLPDGSPLVLDVRRGRELYPGPYDDLVVPDLVFEVDPSVMVLPLSSAAPFAELRRALPDHDLYGIFVAAGPSIASVRERFDVSIFDLAPTALHLLGLPVFREMAGRARTELCAEPGEPQAISEADSPGAGEPAWSTSGAYTEAEREEIRKRLGQLGYVE